MLLGWFWFGFCTGASNVEGAPGVEEAVVDQLEEEGEQVESKDDAKLQVLVVLVDVWQGEQLGSHHD